MSTHNYQRIVNDIINKIESGRLKNGDKLATEFEMCAQYGVSRITVQKAMKVLGENRIVFRIKGKGSFIGDTGTLKNGEKKLIGLVLCSFSAAFGMDIIRAIEKRADQRGFSIILKNSFFDMEKEKEIINLLVRLNVAGIIIQPVPDTIYNPELVKLALNGFPLVTLDRELQGLPVPFIGSDNSAITKKAAKFLFDRGQTDICMFTGHNTEPSSLRQRIDGFKSACVENGTPFLDGMLFSDIYSVQMGDLSIDDVKRDIDAVGQHLTKHPWLKCAFASEYAVARIVRMACQKLGKRIPEDFSIISFDNHNDIFRPNATTFIRQNQEDIGKSSIDTIEQLIIGNTAERKVLFNAEIIDNGSVKKLN